MVELAMILKDVWSLSFQGAGSVPSVKTDTIFWNICKIYILKLFLGRDLIFLSISKDQDTDRIA